VLNPGFSAEADAAYGSNYVVPSSLSGAIVGANSDFATGAELRTQEAYGDELWFRLRELGLGDLPWDRLRVLDACCGTGFLSYHLLHRASPQSLTMLDVSADEVAAAEELVASNGAVGGNVVALCSDLAATDLEQGQFDVVIGNSFLHHFPSVPDVLNTIFGLVKPGGLFVSLHEPTPAAIPWESGDPRHVAAYFLSRTRYMKRLRHRGPGPVRDGTTDVWIFEADEMRKLLVDSGFTDVEVMPRYLLRPFVVALLRLHLTESKPRLSGWQERLLRATVRIDAALRRVLPERAFGGLSFVARRPA
jgi:2-polyprenyl-3-methyl-5-hydroxy-6-metoxy-1,4-benzoquinol methylase